jgi:aspartate/methionine/tyrosine aminotransferase
VFSRRVPSHSESNRISRAVQALRAEGTPFVDLTESNPTKAGIPYPAGIVASLSDPSALRYEPSSLGLLSARRAIADDHLRRGVVVDPAHVVLTSSTSEAYGWLFKLLCNPGEGVLIPRPSYPLFDHLTTLEGVFAYPYGLEYHGRWDVDFDSIASAPPNVRALLLVSPNNPTGSVVSTDELERITAVCKGQGWALVVDEVFADYPLDGDNALTDIATRSEVLCFTLAGLSKTIGLPQLKLGWCVVGGPPAERDAALAALEMVADSYLSVGTPVQVAAPALLSVGASIRDAIQIRIRRNLERLRALRQAAPACEVLRAEGGWSAVLRVPATREEESLVLDLLRDERVLVHPGYFFDFPSEAYLVLSLLPAEDVFADAVGRVLRYVEC